jgi:hypothetical protein
MSIGEGGGDENEQAIGRDGPTAMIVLLLDSEDFGLENR